MGVIRAVVNVEDGIASYTLTLDGVSDGTYQVRGTFPESENTYDTTTINDSIELSMNKKTTMLKCVHVMDNTEVLSPALLVEESESSYMTYDFSLVCVENGVETELDIDEAWESCILEFFSPSGELINIQYPEAPFTQLLYHDTGVNIGSSWGIEIAYVRITYPGCFKYNPCSFLFMAEGYSEALFNSFNEELEYSASDSEAMVIVDSGDDDDDVVESEIEDMGVSSSNNVLDSDEDDSTFDEN